MKKITLALVLLTFSVQAQDFPLPYCEITDSNDVSVEEITSVDFAGTSISNADLANVLIDETANVVDIAQDETYTIEVSGNTFGNFDNDIVAFIDWNQNDVLDDTGEIYEIGTLTNSTGSDGVSVSIAITVPADAVLGTTRIRLTKTYQDADSPAEINPCGIQFNPFGQGVFSGFGQALDFTLQIDTSLSTGEFDTNALTVYPMPVKDVLNVSYKSLIDSIKIYNLLGQEVYSKNTNSDSLQLDLASLTVGTYIIKLFTEQVQHSFKIIKQ